MNPLKKILLIVMTCLLIVMNSFSQQYVKLDNNAIVLKDRLHIRSDSDKSELNTILRSINDISISAIKQKFNHEGSGTQLRGVNTLNDVYEVTFSSSAHILDVAKKIESLDESILYAEPIYVRTFYDQGTDPLAGQQYHLNQIMIAEALEIVPDASDVIIAIVDSGIDLDHEDLSGNLYLNTAETPGNGIDDDGDGYIDNYKGWDFVGSSIQDIIDTPGPIDWSDFEDNDPNTDGSDHGTHVAGIASGVTNNGKGISGVGANAMLMALKCGEDAGGNYQTSVLRGYDAIVYAADHGADIINCSWGGPGYSQFEQDVIDYATNLGSLVVAAAGNDGGEVIGYPASYDNVLSVSNVNSEDLRAGSTTFNFFVDVAAPGVDILSTVFGNYGEKTGTSMASPVVSGVAALVKKRFPSYTPNQIAEQIRVTSDDISGLNTPSLANKLGRGRVNALNALTEISPGVRITSLELIDDDFSLQAGDEVSVTIELTNYLSDVTSLSGEFKLTNVFVTVDDSDVEIGSIASGETVRVEDAFSFTIKEGSPDNMELDMIISFSDGNGYEDWQAFYESANQTFLNIITQEISSTVASNGRFGFLEAGPDATGLGFVFDEENLLYEMGLLVGTGSSSIASSIRNSDSQEAEDDFEIIQKATSVDDVVSKKSDFQISGVIDDSKSSSSNDLKIYYNVYAWNSIGVNNFYIVEYYIKNNSGSTITSLSSGLYSDWDVLDAATNSAGYDPSRKLGYVFASGEPYFASVAALSGGTASYSAIDNSTYTFNDANNYSSISAGIGTQTLSSVDVSNFAGITSSGLAAGDSVAHAYVVLGASSQEEVLETYDTADYIYNTVFQIDRVESFTVTSCSGETVDLSVPDESSLKWYDSFTGGTLLFEGEIFTTDELVEDQVYYVAIISGEDEGLRTPIYVDVVPERNILYDGDLVLCGDEEVELTAPDGDVFLWSTGAETQSIIVSEAGSYSVQVTDNETACSATSETLTFTEEALPDDPIVSTIDDFCIDETILLSVTNAQVEYDYEWVGPNGFFATGSSVEIQEFDNNNIGTYRVSAIGTACSSELVSFSVEPIVKRPEISLDEGTLVSDVVADTYQWMFNGEPISDATGATFLAEETGLYSLVVSFGGCTTTSEDFEVIILSAGEQMREDDIFIYPNPANQFVTIQKDYDRAYFYDLVGNIVKVVNSNNSKQDIDIAELAEGSYVLRINGSFGSETVRLIVRR